MLRLRPISGPGYPVRQAGPKLKAVVWQRLAVPQPVGLWDGHFAKHGRLRLGGQFENLPRAKARRSLVAPLALSLIFVLRSSTFGLLKQAALIFTDVPLGVTGSVIALWLRGLSFSIGSGVTGGPTWT